MKKLLALVFCLALLLSGCGFIPNFSKPSSVATQLTEADSISKLDIYPNLDNFHIVGKFERPEYQALSDIQKSIYIKLDNAAYLMTTGFINLGNCTARDVSQAYFAMRNDRPEYFWLPSEYSLRTTGTKYELCFAKTAEDWRYTKQQRAEAEQKLSELLIDFANTIDPQHSDFELELQAHDWLCNRIEYDHEALKNPDKNFYAWNIVGAMSLGKAVCEGYSKAMQIMMNFVGIECGLVTGTTVEAHMWNTVKIGGDWYHVDLTSNDGDKGIYHFYFNVTDEYIKKSRAIDPLITIVPEQELSNGRFNLFLPKCNSMDQNYHVVNSVYIGSESQIEPTIVSLICDAVRSGRRYVEFACSPKMDFIFGQGDAATFFRIERCISAANAELPAKLRLRSYSYGGVYGALGFMISW